MGISTLSGTKNGTLADFGPRFPKIISKADTNCICKTGFVDNGMCDAGSHMYPGMHHIIITCKAKKM